MKKLYEEVIPLAEAFGDSVIRQERDQTPPVPSQQIPAPVCPISRFRERLRQQRDALPPNEFREYAANILKEFPALRTLVEEFVYPLPSGNGTCTPEAARSWTPESALAKLDGGDPEADAALAKLDGQTAATREAISAALLRLSAGEGCR